MTEIKPRFEFRTFGQGFGIVEQKMRRLSKVENIRESSEIYIMSTANNENNTKIRDGLMDIKVFVKEEKGLEQWNPRMKGSFPMDKSIISSEVFPAFGISMPELDRDQYTLDQFLQEIIISHKELTAVRVFKRRFAFTINNCIAEIGDVYINGAHLQTVNIESVNIDDILKAKSMISLDEYENVNYLIAIKRVIGMEHLPNDFYLK
ncbi:MAG: hypothetical protein KAS21_09685 [Candidatus Aminicenantes bacterium]|nr:hypothetical protein [Candidatus Aminicenantes bacterium]